MGFHTEDVYVAGGDNKILHSWTPGVEKFDTSSFYNWEQDNIPLYDLEERTYYLWEKSGWPTSGAPQVSGVIFSVSADAEGTDAFATNTNIFLSVSSAIDALPDIIRYPIRIEVANFGVLGDLVLNNLHFTDNGALEIVNRNFAPYVPGYYTGGEENASAAVNTAGKGTGVGYPSDNTTDYIATVSSVDVLNTLNDTSCLGIAGVVNNGAGARDIDDVRYITKNISFAQLQHGMTVATGKDTKTARMSAGFAHADPFGGADRLFGNNYGLTQDLSISAYDFSGTTNQITGADISREDIRNGQTYTTGKVPIVGVFYGNFFDKIEVNNCAGKVYIRNFVVDGASGVQAPPSFTTEIGIQVNNSQVVLEHCAASRCRSAGFEFNNSDVILSRGAIAYRNYGLSSNTVADHVRINDPDAAGFRFYNSNVQLSTNGTYGASGGGALFASTRNGTNGVLMHNSTLTGGEKRIAAANSASMTSFQVYENQTRGIKMVGSEINLDGALDVWLHDTGIDAYNSKIILDELYVDCHKTLGLRLNNSQLEYAKNKIEKSNSVAMQSTTAVPTFLYDETPPTYYWTDQPAMVNFDANGQHMILENSQVFHPRLSAGAGISRMKFKRNHGTSLAQDGNDYGALKLSIPGIVCDNNSDLKLTFARLETQSGAAFAAGGGKGAGADTGDRAGTSNASYGSCLLVKNNSTCRLIGGSSKYTLLDGPEDYVDQEYNAGAYVTNNSKLILGGPTLMIRFGVDVLVDNDSILDIKPPKDDSGFVDNAQWDLSATAGNQTKVDLHSTRACLVANNNSVINMEDCGDFNGQWASGAADYAIEGSDDWYASSLVLNANYDTFETSASQVNGSIQFYPNPQLQGSLATYALDGGNFARGLSDNQTFPLKSGNNGVDTNDVTALSFGGMCVRGMKGSSINVRNVNFPAGWNNTSALYYNYDGAGGDPNGCEQLRIWNIDDTSKLDMSYTSVSGHFPPLVGYTGPSAVYTKNTFGGAMEAPDSTWITSGMSVLDGFGSSGSIAGQNFGAFRLYTAPKRFAKYLVYKGGPKTVNGGPYYAPATSDKETSIIYQTVAQGYNMSGPCSSVSLTLSSGPDLYSVYGAGTTSPSGIQNEVSFSSLHASALFDTSPWGTARDARLYTSAIFAVGVSSIVPGETSGMTCPYAPGRGDLGVSATSAADGFPGYSSAWDGQYYNVFAKPYFQHYKEADFFYTKDLIPEGYEHRVRVDESGIATFANAKNGTLGISGRPKIVTMRTSTTSYAGEGAESEATLAGKGFLSASEFDLNKQD